MSREAVLVMADDEPDGPSEVAAVPRRRSLFRGRSVILFLAVFVFGSFLGVGSFTFLYANGIGYLYDDPETCAQCHAMDEYLDGYYQGSHTNVATCNDCHMPHDNIINKYLVKADNGFWHALKFTTGDYPTNIEIRESNRRVTNAACLYCHGDYLSEVHLTRAEGDELDCTRCHETVGHAK